MRYLVAVAALTIPCAGLAQSSSTCTQIGNVTHCQHQPSTSGIPDYSAALGVSAPENYAESRLKRAQADALEIRSRAEQERLSCKRKAMKAIDAGEYEKGKALAALCP